jgi:hypothetical protein
MEGRGVDVAEERMVGATSRGMTGIEGLRTSDFWRHGDAILIGEGIVDIVVGGVGSGAMVVVVVVMMVVVVVAMVVVIGGAAWRRSGRGASSTFIKALGLTTISEAT